ncbi:MAG: hypothetical protein ABL958_20350 [Bdellovibrionia bacterium]
MKLTIPLAICRIELYTKTWIKDQLMTPEKASSSCAREAYGAHEKKATVEGSPSSAVNAEKRLHVSDNPTRHTQLGCSLKKAERELKGNAKWLGILESAMRSPRGGVLRSAAEFVSHTPRLLSREFPFLQCNPETGGLLLGVHFYPDGIEGSWSGFQISVLEMVLPSAKDKTIFSATLFIERNGILRSVAVKRCDPFERKEILGSLIPLFPECSEDFLGSGERLAECLISALKNRFGERQLDGTITRLSPSGRASP